MREWPDITSWLGMLRRSRPVFHSEADFQHALAWAIHLSDPSVSIRLETRPKPGMRLDLLVSRPDLGQHLALELKYLTAAWAGDVDGERFELLSQGAQDIRAYDVVKDIKRVEGFITGRSGADGAVIVLTNDSSYWRPPKANDTSNAVAFRLCEGSVLEGLRQWGPRTGAGTRKGREPALHLVGRYELHWRAYSCLPGGPAGELRQLVIPIANDVRGATVREGQV